MIKQFVTTTVLALATLASAQAGVIVSAQSAQVLVGGGSTAAGDITSTYDMYGLLEDYESGVTDFDSYIASAPLHVWDFSVKEGSTTYYYEWFSASGSTAATVSYDLGSVQQTQGMALWNEDGNGIGKLNILGSVDGVTWTTLASQLSPTDHPAVQDYGADVFSWGNTAARYIKLEMSSCPSPSTSTWVGCSIGEVAFNVSPAVSPIPELNSLTMIGLGLALMGVVVARSRRA